VAYPPYFKGIALFTPGGDIVYAIDPSKQEQWHIHLCLALQDQLQLSEPPHFLVPCFTATVDRWFDAQSGQVQMVAEAKSGLRRYQPLLNALFGLDQVQWHFQPWQEQWCDHQVLASYRSDFPELWHNHNLVLQVERSPSAAPVITRSSAPASTPSLSRYVLRLYVAGINPTTEKTLQALHQCLESALQSPYTLEVVDIFRHPDLADVDQISATPTLIKISPKPTRRIVGQLDPVDKILPFLSDSTLDL
jgi:circadian clock protein KaiB